MFLVWHLHSSGSLVLHMNGRRGFSLFVGVILGLTAAVVLDLGAMLRLTVRQDGHSQQSSSLYAVPIHPPSREDVQKDSAPYTDGSSSGRHRNAAYELGGVSHQNGGAPNENGRAPNENGGVSDENGRAPNENGGVPDENGRAPNDNGGVPDENGRAPNDNGGAPYGNGDMPSHEDNDTEARRLAKEVRVLVWVMTCPDNHQSKARVVRDTWGQRVNKLVFISSINDSSIPTIAVNVSEGRQHLTAKSQKAWRYVYENHFHDADWFMKADDNTYVIMENLRYFLSGENTSEPVHFGHLFKTIVKQGFYSGGSGYVLSKEALRRWGEKGQDVAKLCRQDGQGEDNAMGQCMERLGVRVANSTDAMGRSRFHCFAPDHHILGNYPKWYLTYDANGATAFRGMAKMSDYSIAFHYISPTQMQVMDFLIYHLTPYGILRGFQQLNRPRNSTTV
ncbi:glycoprotein-N-acetylgalactosamine 3-beta-galactosyltransferase 1-like isoform X2 [Littorina saxatilis]|uniref:glycoprotein-N-acetylgalactosamine 3-beta-galactosyltransferase 1-like isoform X2 n=1 Tax=Littorina saxatilis TaxID=31220 RepID=UPI0038B4AFC2